MLRLDLLEGLLEKLVRIRKRYKRIWENKFRLDRFLKMRSSLKSNSYKILLFIVFLAIHQYFIDTGSVHVDNLEFQLVPGDFLAGMGDVFQ